VRNDDLAQGLKVVRLVNQSQHPVRQHLAL